MTVIPAYRTCFTVKICSWYVAIADLVADSEQENSAWLTRINVPPKYRGKGYARTLLRQVCEEADKHGIILKLQVSASGDHDKGALNDEELYEWYSRNGFKSIPSEKYVMERRPRASS